MEGQFRPVTLRRAALFLPLLWLLRAMPAEGQQTIALEGWVRTEDGGIIPSGVMIRLETVEGTVAAQQSPTSAGQFEIPGLAKIAYHLTVTAEGFQTYEQPLDLTRAGDKVGLSVYLTPLGKTKQAVAGSPTLTDSKAPKKAHQEYEKGERALRSKDFSGAQTHFEKAVEQYPCYARAHTELALALTEQRELARAEAALRKAIECDPDFIDAYAQLGWLLNGERRYSESLTALEGGLRRSPGAWQFYYQLGAAYYGLKDYNKAEEEYLRAESLNPNPPEEIHVKLADVYFKKNAFDKAYAEMESYLRADPNGRFAPKIRDFKKRLESSGLVHTAQSQTSQPPKP